LIIAASLHDHIIRPLQTLANVVGALREEDYSFRARLAVPNDALGEALSRSEHTGKPSRRAPHRSEGSDDTAAARGRTGGYSDLSFRSIGSASASEYCWRTSAATDVCKAAWEPPQSSA
jgi:hypothetical protein